METVHNTDLIISFVNILKMLKPFLLSFLCLFSSSSSILNCCFEISEHSHSRLIFDFVFFLSLARFLSFIFQQKKKNNEKHCLKTQSEVKIILTEVTIKVQQIQLMGNKNIADNHFKKQH